MARKLFLLFAGLLCAAASGRAQQARRPFALADALGAAFAHNFDVRIARNNADQAARNVTPGNAGLLPTVSLDAGATYSRNDTRLDFAGDLPNQERNGAQTRNVNASLNATYVLFDGLGTVYALHRLRAQSDQSEAQVRLQLETTALQVAAAYFEAARRYAALDVARQALALSADRLQRSQLRADYGAANRLEALNSRVDYNTDSLALAEAELALRAAERSLHLAMGAPEDLPATGYDLTTPPQLADDLQLETLETQALADNASLLPVYLQQSLAELDVRSAKAAQYPRLTANLGYGFNRNTTDAGIVLENRNLGLNAGLALRFNLFDGRRQNLRIQQAEVALANSRLQYAQTQAQIRNNLLAAWDTYQLRRSLAEVASQDVAAAETNFNRTRDAFAVGQVNATQFREAQLNLVRAQNRIVDARFLAKLAELDLLALSGQILGD